MWWIYNKAVNICRVFSSLKELFEFCWSPFTDEHNILPKIDQEKSKIEQIWIWNPMTTRPLCKHWFTPSVKNFCHWVSDIFPCETSPVMRSEEKRLFSQATLWWGTLNWNLIPRIEKFDPHLRFWSKSPPYPLVSPPRSGTKLIAG